MPVSCIAQSNSTTMTTTSAQSSHPMDLSSSYDDEGSLLGHTNEPLPYRPANERDEIDVFGSDDDEDSLKSISPTHRSHRQIIQEEEQDYPAQMSSAQESIQAVSDAAMVDGDDDEKIPCFKSGKGANGVRRCNYCGATSTPMWRHGPGEFTNLCNSCGVKWRRGKILQSKKYRHHLCKSSSSSGAGGGKRGTGSNGRRGRAGSSSSGTSFSGVLNNTAGNVSKRHQASHSSSAKTPRQGFASLPPGSTTAIQSVHMLSPVSSSSSGSDDAYSPASLKRTSRLKRMAATPPQINTNMVQRVIHQKMVASSPYEVLTPLSRTHSLQSNSRGGHALGGVYTSNVYTDPAATAAQYRQQLSQHASRRETYECLPTPPVNQAPMSPFKSTNSMTSDLMMKRQGSSSSTSLKLKLPRSLAKATPLARSSSCFGTSSELDTTPLFDSLATPTSLDDRPDAFPLPPTSDTCSLQEQQQQQQQRKKSEPKPTWIGREDEIYQPLSVQVSDRIQQVARILQSLDGSRINSFVSILSKSGMIDHRSLNSGHEICLDVHTLPASTFVELETLLVQ